MEINWPYTTIQHEIRKTSGVTCEEYIVADMIYHLQNNKESKIPGWFYGNRDSLAKEVGVSRRTIVRIINSLVDAGYLERDDTTSYLRTTINWDRMFVAQGVTGWHSSRAELARDRGDSLAPNNNNIYSLLLITNNNENTPDFKKSVSEINGFLKSKFLAKYKKENGTDFYFTPKEAGKMKGIVQKIIFKMKEKSGQEFFSKEDVEKAIEFFVEYSWNTGDTYVKNNFSLTTLDSKFNEIFTRIKNTSNGQIANKQPGQRTGVTDFKFNVPDVVV